MATASLFKDLFESCTRYLSKYNRIQPSLCQCKHCSESFCVDCMREHNDEIQQDIAEVSNRYNEVQQLIKTNRELITSETMQSKQQLSEWFQKYIQSLTVEKARIDMEIENEEKQAQKFMSEMESALQTYSNDVEGFIKTGAFQSTHLKKLLE